MTAARAMWFTTSWDDGHPLDERLAELMSKHGIAGTFYCPDTNHEGLPVMAAAALRAIDGHFEIGSHTLEHAYANRMPAAAWRVQVQQGKARLENALGHAVQGFCYPGGKMTPDSRAAVAAAGFAYARTTENFRSDCGDDVLTLPTSLQFFPHSRAVLLRNFARRGRWGRRLALAAACLGNPDFEPRLRRALEVCQRGNGTFHLWGHSWEVERHSLWDPLARFFAHVSATVPASARLANGALLRAQGLLA